MADDNYIKERENVIIENTEIKTDSKEEGIFSNIEINNCETEIERQDDWLNIFTNYGNDTIKIELKLTKEIREKLRKLLDDD